MRFQVLSTFVFAALTAAAPSIPEGVISIAAMKEWLSTTDVELTYSGLPIEALGVNPLVTTITFCSTRTANLCSGPCNVFTGAGVCHATPGTNCLAATTDVSFCDGANCGGSCHTLSACGTRLDNGFCFTPGTNSISLPA
ncbi:hypothetical protein MVEN_02558000 [Mycena venus]|uniref:Uncharacterized protein n=1 Tax=Mycena venus TaxID=2733690 RepID=A0A8H6U443_9AGAR|nr:hypothetical protein MVEN_02558000 [Mycena venus]